MSFEELPEYMAQGRDSAEFLISTNPGEPLRPLMKIASGGELSRIMLPSRPCWQTGMRLTR